MDSTDNISDHLTLENVRQDKIELKIGTWEVEAIDLEMTGFLDYLGNIDSRAHARSPRAFRKPSDLKPIRRSRYLSVLFPRTNGTSLRDEAPLFGGSLHIKCINHSDTTDRYTLRLILSINPTRFCIYQLPAHRTRSTPYRRLNDTPILFATQDQISFQGEHSLTKNDNVILKPVARINASSNLWEQNLRRYIEEITEYFERELQDYLANSFRYEPRESGYTLGAVENYWDIHHQNPIYFVESIKDQFISVANDSSVSIYHSPDHFYRGPALCLRAEFRSGERLKIYAKTNKRVRFEVSHKFRRNPALAQDRRYSANSINGLISLINTSSAEATALASEFWSTLRSYILRSEIGGGDALYFVNTFYAAIGDIELAGELLSVLALQGGTSRRHSPQVWRDALNDLQCLGLVEWHGSPINRYVIHPRFDRCVRQMASRQHRNR